MNEEVVVMMIQYLVMRKRSSYFCMTIDVDKLTIGKLVLINFDF